MKRLRLLLLPFSWLYGAVLFLRHFFYDRGLYTRYSFEKPVLVVGNLVVGGAGKSPMTEYLLRLLSTRTRVATLSRGYGRKSKGYLEVQADSTAAEVGDEPLQVKRKFPWVTVADCEDRVEGLKRLMPQHEIFILDDAFQHRRLQPGVSILLFDFDSLKRNKFLLPAGDYRDLFLRRNFADIIVITKAPKLITAEEKQGAKQLLRLKKEVPVFFTYIEYGHLSSLTTDERVPFPVGAKFMLVTGIANPKPLSDYLNTKGEILKEMNFPDHHQFSTNDLRNIRKYAQSLPDCLIITTEKDAMRLQSPEVVSQLSGLPVYYIPIEIKFHMEGDELPFDTLIKEKVLKDVS
ncbi:tetraacyldisaccharide 4'-kinase [Olivibacter sp. XZL3]|uniref:tetraacyldisaccharide 4'-kinase n=1 Tax=Olivibacter sp. XZL3 TaxID=1735116 RepID=UPI0010667D1C|nr:tetraacyldisaccharide 4'-kinase [Olivibacter sp. XZL3]